MSSPNKTVEIIPTCVPQSADDLRAQIQKVSVFSGAIHLDIDDGIFTPKASWPYIKKGSGERGIEALDIPVDNFVIQIHLMVSDGREAGADFIRAGAHSIIAHVESDTADPNTFDEWRSLGVREIGIAILLDTPMEKLDPLLPFCNFIQVMSVASIGAQGAPFDPRAIDRVKEIRSRFPSYPISVDGGISLANIASLVQAGATRFVVGSDIMHNASVALEADEYVRLKKAAENALQ